MINILIVVYSVIAAIIGAGFASGQEMLLYFVCFGKNGIAGIFITVVAFMLFIYCVLYICIAKGYRDYDSFLNIFKSTRSRICVKAITLVFSFAVYGAMISATGELLYDFFGIELALGTLLCAIGSTILFCTAGDRIFTFNGVLGILLVVFITFSILYMLSYREFHAFSPTYTKSYASGLIYSGYNLVSLTPVLVTLSKRLKTNSDSLAVSLSTGIISGIIMTLIFGLLSIYAGKINLGELPLLTLARRQNPNFATLYAFILTAAILTTLISSGGGLCSALKLRKKPIKTGLLSMSAYLLASFGFSNLINTAYRICGIAGLVVCIVTITTIFKKTKNN